MSNFDVIIIGAGIAGASVAYELGDARLLLLEREAQPSYHATGRSAAAFIPSYGYQNTPLRLLTQHSLPFLDSPPDKFCDAPLLNKRGLLTLSTSEGAAAALAEYNTLLQHFPNLQLLEPDAARHLVPELQAHYLHTSWLEPDVFDIDVAGLHQGYLRTLRHRSSLKDRATIEYNAEVTRINRQKTTWTVHTTNESYTAPVVINATGAWADVIATLAGIKPIGIAPLRRTAVLIDPPANSDVSSWPLLLSNDKGFYLKPEAGSLLASPADEHPSEPVDAQPEEMDIAYAVHYAQQALQLAEPKVQHSWAGLRTFAPDRTPVVGFEPEHSGFFWLCGHGGHGIQTAPATARLAAALASGKAVPHNLSDGGFDPATVAPDRFR